MIDQLFEKAIQLYNENDYLGALKVNDEILAIDNDDTFAMYNKGIMLDNLGNPEEALV